MPLWMRSTGFEAVDRFERLSGTRYITLEPVRLRIESGSALFKMDVPEGFVFDVSVPRPLRWIFDPHDKRFLPASALHDYALHELKWPRALSAAPFSYSLRQQGVSRIKRLAMVLAVIVWRWK